MNEQSFRVPSLSLPAISDNQWMEQSPPETDAHCRSEALHWITEGSSNLWQAKGILDGA